MGEPSDFTERMLRTRGLSLDGMRIAISGSGNVAMYATEKAQELGGKVITCSDSSGYVVDKCACQHHDQDGSDGDPVGRDKPSPLGIHGKALGPDIS